MSFRLALFGYRRIWVPSEPTFDPGRVLGPSATRTSATALPFHGFDATISMGVSTWQANPLPAGTSRKAD